MYVRASKVGMQIKTLYRMHCIQADDKVQTE